MFTRLSAPMLSFPEWSSWSTSYPMDFMANSREYDGVLPKAVVVADCLKFNPRFGVPTGNFKFDAV